MKRVDLVCAVASKEPERSLFCWGMFCCQYCSVSLELFIQHKSGTIIVRKRESRTNHLYMDFKCIVCHIGDEADLYFSVYDPAEQTFLRSVTFNDWLKGKSMCLLMLAICVLQWTVCDTHNQARTSGRPHHATCYKCCVRGWFSVVAISDCDSASLWVDSKNDV